MHSTSKHQVNIVEVNEDENLGSCKPYYETLPEKLRQVELKFLNDKRIVGSECLHGGQICTPYSLPVGKNKIPICQNMQQQACAHSIIEYLEKDMRSHCKKTARVKEFKAIRFGCARNISIDPPNSYVLEYMLQLPPSSKNHMSKELFKTVKREYFIVDTMSLVGNVGGTLGMFIGFSFFGISDWMFNIISDFWSRK